MTTMKKHIVSTAAAMAVTALMAFQPVTAFAATGNCGNAAYYNGCKIQVCQSYGCDSGNCGQNDFCTSVPAAIGKKKLSAKNCTSPQKITYVIGNSGCRR